MRQRAKRDLIALGGVIVIIAVLFVVNYTFSVGANAEKMDKVRRAAESAREKDGMELLKWRHMRDTEGNLRKGPIFTEDLKKFNNTQVNLVGFMVPENEFRDVKEFILLPLPIECYFCKRPPVHDVMMIQMEENTTTKIYEGPILVNGVLRLHEGPNQKYFYSIEHAALESAEKGGTLKTRYIPPEHMMPQHTQEVTLDEGIELKGDEAK
jgi:hypothetical protein